MKSGEVMEKICKIVYFDEDSVTDYVQIVAGGELENKSISKTMGGELLRIQFSMMQTTEAYNYVFGAEHSKGSFARDMMARESNVILIDEFDKVNPENAIFDRLSEVFIIS